MVINLVLEHHSPAAYERLRQQVESGNLRIAALEQEIRSLELRYGAEIQYNAALIDILREHGIQFRQVLSHDVRYRKKP